MSEYEIKIVKSKSFKVKGRSLNDAVQNATNIVSGSKDEGWHIEYQPLGARNITKDLLDDMDFNQKLEGYNIIIECVQYLLEHENAVLQSNVYAYVGRAFNKSVQSVERCIRSSIKDASKNGNLDLYFEISSQSSVSNKIFLYKITNIVHTKISHNMNW